MDGNGRWAKKRGLPRTVGHKRGIERVKEIVREAKKLGVKIFTIFAFSTENWDRPPKEIKFLFSYLESFLDNYRDELMKDAIKLKAIGRRDRIDKQAMKKIEEIEELTAGNKSFIFNIALDYGGRWDIVQAVKKIGNSLTKEKISEINEDNFGAFLSLAGLPDPGFLIRTSGEQRISNFLIWNLAYAEFYFAPCFWPDFSKSQLHKALEVYSKRSRRFGKING
jgi:undecaprenyl diphosphate synthase